MSQIAQLQACLERNPGNWELRALVVELLAAAGNPDAARKLVRDAPPAPVPYHIQKRFWNALAPSAGISVETGSGAKPILKAKARMVRPETGVLRRDAPKRSRALMPRRLPAKPLRFRSRSGPGSTEPPRLHLVSLDAGLAAPAPTSGSRRSLALTSVTAALIVHLLLAFALSTVVLQTYLHLAPSITVLIGRDAARADEVLEKPLISREVVAPSPAAPSQANAPFLLSSAASAVSLPRFDSLERNTGLNLPDAGFGVSQGLTFDVAGAETAVNFFGIRRGSQCMIFLVEASPHMLLDEKGGMYAYDKVKQEIATLLQTLHRGTAFNLILFDYKRLRLFQSQPVRALPSMVERAIAWMDPVNRDYSDLGLGTHSVLDAVQPGAKPILAGDIAHYAKALQVALEQKAHTVFCITSGWRDLPRSLSPEDQARLDEAQRKRTGESEARFDPKDVEAWRRAQEKARNWLARENEARAARDLPPKVVIDFGALVRKLSPGAAPPRPINESPGEGSGIQRPPPYSPDEVEDHIRNLVRVNYGKESSRQPSINLVLFLGEEEAERDLRTSGPQERHFLNLTRHNKGKLKILRGLAALEDVTSTR